MAFHEPLYIPYHFIPLTEQPTLFGAKTEKPANEKGTQEAGQLGGRVCVCESGAPM